MGNFVFRVKQECKEALEIFSETQLNFTMSDNLHVLESTSFSCDLSLSLASLLASSSLCDVTLVCIDGHLLAHKVILAATSSFFNSVFSLNQHNLPLIFLRGVKTDQMKAVLDFLYSGVVNVTEDGVEDFLEVANDLKIEGLMVQYKKKRKTKRKASNDMENEEAPNGQEVAEEIAIDPSDEVKVPETKKSKPVKKRSYVKKRKVEEDFALDLPSGEEDVEINLINQKIKETTNK